MGRPSVLALSVRRQHARPSWRPPRPRVDDTALADIVGRVSPLQLALDEADAVVRASPDSVPAWRARARALTALGRHLDAVVSMQQFANSSRGAAKDMHDCQKRLADGLIALGPLVPESVDMTKSADERLTAWRGVMEADPTNVMPRVELATADVQRAVRLREAGDAAAAAALVSDVALSLL